MPITFNCKCGNFISLSVPLKAPFYTCSQCGEVLQIPDSPCNLTVPEFDEGKPFHALIVNYMILFNGYRDIVDKLEFVLVKQTDDQTQTEIISTSACFHDLVFHTRTKGVECLSQNMVRLVAQVAMHKGPTDYLTRSASSLFILGYELTKHCNDNTPIWEFLRHCRNAAAHKGRFNLVGQVPRRPASWAGLTIDPSLHGKLLVDSFQDIGFLSVGDPILLLHDLETLYPSIGFPPD